MVKTPAKRQLTNIVFSFYGELLVRQKILIPEIAYVIWSYAWYARIN
jgi:hypothetical protein